MLANLPHRTVIDVGANRGQFALAVKRYSPQAQIRSFEPVPSAARIFRQVFQGDPGVSLVQTALGSSKATEMMNVANREDAADINIDDLVIKEVRVDVGPTLKRFRPRAMGRASRIRKRSCHITITLSDGKA